MSVEQLSESQVVAWNSRIFIMTHVSEADLHPSSKCFGCILENAGKKKNQAGDVLLFLSLPVWLGGL